MPATCEEHQRQCSDQHDRHEQQDPGRRLRPASSQFLLDRIPCCVVGHSSCRSLPRPGEPGVSLRRADRARWRDDGENEVSGCRLGNRNGSHGRVNRAHPDRLPAVIAAVPRLIAALIG